MRWEVGELMSCMLESISKLLARKPSPDQQEFSARHYILTVCMLSTKVECRRMPANSPKDSFFFKLDNVARQTGGQVAKKKNFFFVSFHPSLPLATWSCSLQKLTPDCRLETRWNPWGITISTFYKTNGKAMGEKKNTIKLKCTIKNRKLR